MSQEFFLDEHEVEVDVCGVKCWVTDGDGSVSSNHGDAIQYFLKSAAERLVREHFSFEHNGKVVTKTSINITNRPVDPVINKILEDFKH